MLDDPEYRKARIAEARATLKQRNPLLARELGISEKQADAIIDIMAEGEVREDAQSVELAATGKTDAASVAEMQRVLQAQQQQDQSAIMSMLGPAKYQQFDEIQQTQIARVRMVNLKSLMAQSGYPLSTEQELSLTRVVAAQQQREERETQQLRDSGQWNQAAQVERAIEGDRRILDNASGILSAQQLETVRTRFEQRQAMEKATGSVTSRERAPGP
jgi:trehalose/maltose hydrolase-like predicted phosphorylase